MASSTSEMSAPYLRGLFIITQVLLLPFFFVGTKSPGDDFVYDVREYIVFKDIMAMLLIGFGYLMTFLKSYGLGAVGFTLLLTALVMQVSIPIEYLMRFLINGSDETNWPMPVNMLTFIEAEFAAAAILITFGALIGRVTPLQLTVLALCETAFYAYNKIVLVFGYLEAEDIGGTISIHMFGAYFGLAVSYALGPPPQTKAAVPDKVSDILAMIGTTILWIYWPSFVGAVETSHSQNQMRCVSHTIFALLASTLTSFTLSHLIGNGKFDPVHVANSTLAGGVAIGSIARLNVGAGGSVLVGTIGGICSVLGYEFSSPYLESKGIHDTAGVGNLHGYPSLIGALFSMIYVAVDSDAVFLQHGTASQVVRQMLAMIGTLLVSLLSGYATGKILVRLPGRDTEALDYHDVVWWQQADYAEVPNKSNDNHGEEL